jgi:hypothetical protein
MAWEIQSRSLIFTGGRNEAAATPIVFLADFPGARAINAAFAAIASFNIQFLEGDHHLREIGIRLAAPTTGPTLGGFGVRVAGTLPFRDDGRFDDRYRVDVTVLIIADVVR